MPSVKQRTLKLSEPVTFAGIEYDQLTFKKLKAKHLLEMGEAKNPIEQTFALAAASAGVDVGVIHELDLEDVVAMQALLEDFFPQALRGSTQAQPAASQES